MKKNVLLMILVTFWVQGISQSIVDSNKLWSNLIFQAIYGNISTESIRFTGDTIINLQSYKKVVRSLDETQSNWYYYGYIREDGNKRVYYRMNATEPERLLYDLGLALNDSILAYGLTSFFDSVFLESETYHITTIDSIMIGNAYHKQLHLSIRSNTSFIEVERWVDSMGSMSGMLHNMMGLGYDGFTLLCFKEDDILKYHNPSYTTCYLVSSVDPLSNTNDMIKIYPNPVSDISTLTVNGINERKELYINFYNPLGQIIYTKYFIREFQIYKNEMPAGIYFYNISGKSGNLASGKIIIN